MPRIYTLDTCPGQWWLRSLAYTTHSVGASARSVVCSVRRHSFSMTDDDVSVPALAARAKMAPAALYAHFPSIEVVFAELYLDRVVQLPLDIDPAASATSRVIEQLTAPHAVDGR